MENLISTIQKELDSNSLYLNHCNSEIQLLRSINGICCDGNDLTPILKLKSIESLKRILNELLTEKIRRKECEILTDQIVQKKVTPLKNELSKTIQNELEGNSLYLNFCNTNIQTLRGFVGHSYDLGLILNLKSVETLKSILNELLTKKGEQAQRTSKEFEILTDQIAQKVEFNPDFEKANLQLLSDFNARLSGKDLEDKNDRI